MKILLTGSEGNLGSQIIKNCCHDIIGLDRHNWDRLSDVLASGVDVVIHTAYDLKNRIENLPCEIMNSNILLTTMLLEQMKYAKTPRIVFISSCAVYGECMRTSEDTACNPVSFNGLVKLINERIVESYCLENNIKFEIYRLFNMYGGNDNFSVISKLLNAVKRSKEFVLNNNGLSQRDFIHVEDVAKVVLKLLDKGNDYSHINIGTGFSTKISRIVDLVGEKVPELKVKKTFLPEAEYSRADIARLNSLIDYNFINVLDFIKTQF